MSYDFVRSIAIQLTLFAPIAISASLGPPNPPPATITSLSKTGLLRGQSSVALTITGTASGGSPFYDQMSPHLAVAIDGGVTVNSVTVVNGTTINVTVSTVGAALGTHTITVTNPDGQQTSRALLSVLAVTP